MRRRIMATLGFALTLFCVWALWEAWRQDGTEPPAETRGFEAPAGVDAPPPGRAQGLSSSPGPPVVGRRARPDASRCKPYFERRCVHGDVYWIDSCGNPHDRQEECGEALCRAGACLARDPVRCAELTPEGRCEGDVARGCLGGAVYERDCAALGKRCVMTGEGAQCRARSRDACDPVDTPPRCEGTRLVYCRDGELRFIDCIERDAICGIVPGAARARCHRVTTRTDPPDPSDACEPCGCPSSSAAGEERCDGRDNDGDESVDEEVECEAIPIVAFVVAEGEGGGSYAREDLDREVERVNRVFGESAGGLGLRVELSEVLRLDRPDWLSLDDAELDEVLAAPELELARDEFYVPIVFTDTIERGDTPKAGVSTIPNGRCGGRRVSDEVMRHRGGIVVAKGRAPTTVAHELGHYLGLCHTHFELVEEVPRVVQWQDARGDWVARPCAPPCVSGGDGMCDTPPDPGPEQCVYDQACQVACPGGELPDPFNVMSYYTSCRYSLSEQQALELRRNLQLRREWYRCRGEACPCDPSQAQCPQEMTCRPGRAPGEAWACSLDGPFEVGARCEDSAQCGADSICVRPDGAAARCLRVCAPADSDCDCQPVPSLGVGLCWLTAPAPSER